MFLVIGGYVEPLKWITNVNVCVPPEFTCIVLQSTLELGVDGQLDFIDSPELKLVNSYFDIPHQ